MLSHPYLSEPCYLRLFVVLYDLGYQAEVDAVCGAPVAHTEALAQLLHNRAEELEDAASLREVQAAGFLR